VCTQLFPSTLTKKTLKTVFAVFALVLITACASTNNRPGWIDSPPSGGLSAIGSASYDIFGESWARERAVKKALAELAIQKGSSVEVSGEVSNRQTVSGNSFSERATVSTNAIIKGQQVEVNAKIEKYWKDGLRKKVWVLLREN